MSFVLLKHVRQELSDNPEVTLKVHNKTFAQHLFVHIHDSFRLDNSRIVDDDVDMPKLFSGLVC